jgi:alpha-D-ribose 1-methylphosphonate 5-triphosphate synthase subunit PhnH
MTGSQAANGQGFASPAMGSGFPDPVFDSQRIFRLTLEALSHPGRVIELPAVLDSVPLVPASAAAICLALADLDTPVWIQPGKSGLANEIAALLRFHCGCPITDDPANAAFALVHDAASLAGLQKFSAGSAEYPDRSTTLLVAVPALEQGDPWTLKGPGIPGHRSLAPAGLPETFRREWGENASLFPRGIDLILCCGPRIAGLPRTTMIGN